MERVTVALAWILAAGQPPAREDECVTTAKHGRGDCTPSAREGGAAREAATLALTCRSRVAGLTPPEVREGGA